MILEIWFVGVKDDCFFDFVIRFNRIVVNCNRIGMFIVEVEYRIYIE